MHLTAGDAFKAIQQDPPAVQYAREVGKGRAQTYKTCE